MRAAIGCLALVSVGVDSARATEACCTGTNDGTTNGLAFELVTAAISVASVVLEAPTLTIRLRWYRQDLIAEKIHHRHVSLRRQSSRATVIHTT